MHSSALGRFDFESHRTANTLEALQNLIYLIQMDATDPDLVKKYAGHAERIVQQHFNFPTVH